MTPELREHLARAARQFDPVSSQNWVEAALPMALRFPFPGYTAETIAAGIVTEQYLSSRGRYSEVLPVLGRNEAAIGRSYAGRLLIELVQNTEDAYREVERFGTLRVSGRIRDDGRTWITFEHDGKPFDAADVDGFRLQRSSTKPTKRRRIGRFGIGIKSVLSVADSIELHSGGFHLRFEGEGDWPVFLCPIPLKSPPPGATGPAVQIALRWREATPPEQALKDLVSGFDESELVFLDMLREVIVGEVRFALTRRTDTGPFETFTGQSGRTFWRIGDPEIATVALVSQPNEEGLEVLHPVESFLHAYFRVTKCPTRIGFLAHAPFQLSEDRESFSLATAEHRDANLALLSRISELARDAVRAARATRLDLSALPRTVLGPSGGLGDAITSIRSAAKAHGNPLATQSPDDVLRAALSTALAGEALHPTLSGELAAGSELLFGAKLQHFWNAAFPTPGRLPTDATVEWLLAAPRSEVGVVDAGLTRFVQELDAITAEPAVGPVRPLASDDGRTAARLRLLLSLQSEVQHTVAPGSFPHPVLGRARGRVFLSKGTPAFLAEDLERLGVAVLDTRPWNELEPAQRNSVEFWFSQRGVPHLDPHTILREVDRLRRVSSDAADDASLLRIAAAVSDGAPGRAALAGAWSQLFLTRHLWNNSDRSLWTTSAQAVWRSRVRCPARDGVWRPVGDLSLSADLGPGHQVDVDRVSATLGTSPESAALIVASMGAAPGVPIRLRFTIPLQDGWDDELAEFRREVPEECWNPRASGEYARALFGFARGERKALFADHPTQQFPTNDHYENASYVAGAPGQDLSQLALLADAALPDGATPAMARTVATNREWLSYLSAPLFNQRLNLSRRAGPRGAYPSRLLHELRGIRFVRTAGEDGGRAGSTQASPRNLVRTEDLPKAQWALSAKAHLPLVAREDLEELQHALDPLGIVSIAATRDLRHLLRALFLLVERRPRDPAEASARRPYRAAWRELVGLIGDLVLPQTRRGRSRSQKEINEANIRLAQAMADAAYLGWIPKDASTPARFPVFLSSPHHDWMDAGECAKPSVSDCVFFLGEGVRADGYEDVRFVDLGENPIAFARVLRVPIFRPLPGTYELIQGDPGGGQAYLRQLIIDLLPAIRTIVTTRAPGGGFPMGDDLFSERVELNRLRDPRIRAVASWPCDTPLQEPAGGRVVRASAVAPAFLFERLGEGPVLLADHRCVADPVSLHANLWRLDLALANALESPGHADAIQNLLRVVAATTPGGSPQERAAKVRELLGRDGPVEDTRATDPGPAPGPAEDVQDLVGFYGMLFHFADTRAAALLLATPTLTEALGNAVLPWHETHVGRLVNGSSPLAPEDLARIAFGEEAPLEALSSAPSYREWLLDLGRGLPGFEEVRRRLERGTRFRFRGELFESTADAEQRLGKAVDELPLAIAQTAHPAPGKPSGRDVRGSGGASRFAAAGTITGVLGERYARRWLAESRQVAPFLIVDVSTPAAREAATYPPQYGRPDPNYSPGCDVLVFEREGDALPTGYEVKSRAGNGPIQFEMTRREREACEQVARGERDVRWPLGCYRVLAVSSLLASSIPPSVVLLEANDCIEGGEASGFTVRATVGEDDS